MKEFWHMLVFGIVTLLFIVMNVHLAAFVETNDQKRMRQMNHELTQLFSWNYHETSNPTKRIRLEAALKRLTAVYGCAPVAIPDLRAQCKGPDPEIWELLNSLLEEEK